MKSTGAENEEDPPGQEQGEGVGKPEPNPPDRQEQQDDAVGAPEAQES